MPYGLASMLLLGEGSEATEPSNKYNKIRPHSIRSLQFDQKVRPLSFRPQKVDLYTATPLDGTQKNGTQPVFVKIAQELISRMDDKRSKGVAVNRSNFSGRKD